MTDQAFLGDRGHQLAGAVHVYEAPFWNDGQRQFLSEQLKSDADWAIIVDELNVKQVEYVSDETELCDVSYKANFKTLGKKCGPKMKAVAAAIASWRSRADFGDVDGVAIAEEDVIVTRSPKAGLVVASEGATVVALETALTLELVAEGLAREFVSHVQNMRKDADFEVTQRISLAVQTDAEMRAALEAHADYVKGETLALELSFPESAPAGAATAALNGHDTAISVTPVTRLGASNLV